MIEIVPSDMEELAQFIRRISGSEIPLSQATARLSWILLANPARDTEDPLGWIIRNQKAEIVGCLCCAYQKFQLNSAVFKLMMANSFYVDELHRGSGTSLFRKFLQHNRQLPLFASSTNPLVAEMWRKLGGSPLGNSDYEMLGIVRWAPLVAERIYRKSWGDRLAQTVSTLISVAAPARRGSLTESAGRMAPVDGAEQAAFICDQHHCDKITSLRDVSFLRWRYFSQADSSNRLWAFRPEGQETTFLIAVRMQNRGYRGQIRALHVLDIWGEPSEKLCLQVADALWREYGAKIDVLVFRCLSPELRRRLADKGFKARQFAAPIAWYIDKYGVLPTKDWYFVPADGDMFL